MPQSQDMRHRFRAAGRRITPQRSLVFDLLDGNTDHPTAESLHLQAVQTMPTMSLRTVYAILGELEALGAVRSLDLGTGSKRFCVNPTPHHHIVCERCGRVRDVYVELGPLDIPPDERRGFHVRGYQVIIRGVCADCRRPRGSA